MGGERRTLITAGELATVLEAGGDTVLLDVRWALGDARGREHYEDGHIPGAVFVDLETELSAAPSPEAGRHPLPDARNFAASARSWGINTDSAEPPCAKPIKSFVVPSLLTVRVISCEESVAISSSRGRRRFGIESSLRLGRPLAR